METKRLESMDSKRKRISDTREKAKSVVPSVSSNYQLSQHLIEATCDLHESILEMNGLLLSLSGATRDPESLERSFEAREVIVAEKRSWFSGLFRHKETDEA
jgi:hypothetical protein